MSPGPSPLTPGLSVVRGQVVDDEARAKSARCRRVGGWLGTAVSGRSPGLAFGAWNNDRLERFGSLRIDARLEEEVAMNRLSCAAGRADRVIKAAEEPMPASQASHHQGSCRNDR